MLQLTKSLAMQKKASELIPGMTQLLSKRPDMFSSGVWPGYFKKAKGVEIEDLDGNRYLDFSIGGVGATVLGYADDEVNTAVTQVIANGSASSLNAPEEVSLAEKLTELHPWAEMARFARSGGEAMAVAVRIARTYTGRNKIVFCGYHGWMDWYLAANLKNENALSDHLIAGLSPAGVPLQLGGTAIPFHLNDPEEFLQAVKTAGSDLAAIVMEPIRNFEPHPSFIQLVQNTAVEQNVPLILDEISAGFRICSGGAHLRLGWQPDIAVFAKAMGNGFPISAVIGKKWVMSAAENSFISSTNWTERVGPAAALATISKFQRVNASEHLVALGKKVEEGWCSIAKKYKIKLKVSGIKPMLHFTFGENHNVNRAYYTQEMAKRGFLAGMLFYAMNAHTFEQVEQYLEATDEIWSVIAAGDVASKLEGKPAKAGFQRLN